MPTLLLTNDDGIDAPGLAVLREAAQGLGTVEVVAPDSAFSGCGHQATMREVIQTDARAGGLAVRGTPVDCVRLALHGLAARPDLVVSGVNAGANLGVDVYRSGTVAAAREAAHHGLPALAISQFKRPDGDFPWEQALPLVRAALVEALAAPPSPGTFLNVNLPHLPPGSPPPAVVRCPLDVAPWPLLFEAFAGGWRYRGRLLDRPRTPGRDVDVCFGGAVSVSTLEA